MTTNDGSKRKLKQENQGIILTMMLGDSKSRHLLIDWGHISGVRFGDEIKRFFHDSQGSVLAW
jgi:hypothetical protein